MDIGQRIKYFRQLRGISREQLANLIGLSKFAIAKYEQNQRNVDMGTLKKISEILDVPFFILTNSGLNAFAAQLDTSLKFQDDTLETLADRLSIPLDEIKNTYYGFLDKVSFDTLTKIAMAYKEDVNDLMYWSKDFFVLTKTPKLIEDTVNKTFPTLDPIMQLLSNPKIEMAYNFTYNDLAACGYEELLFIAIEKAIKNTLEEIKEHEKNGDIFDGLNSWISKESPVYEIIKKSHGNNKKAMNEMIEKSKDEDK